MRLKPKLKQEKIDSNEIADNHLLSMTPKEVGTWIDNHVNDLQSAKTAIKYVAMLVIYLLRRK